MLISITLLHNQQSCVGLLYWQCSACCKTISSLLSKLFLQLFQAERFPDFDFLLYMLHTPVTNRLEQNLLQHCNFLYQQRAKQLRVLFYLMAHVLKCLFLGTFSPFCPAPAGMPCLLISLFNKLRLVTMSFYYQCDYSQQRKHQLPQLDKQ